jgi:hypothetical protein
MPDFFDLLDQPFHSNPLMVNAPFMCMGSFCSCLSVSIKKQTHIAPPRAGFFLSRRPEQDHAGLRYTILKSCSRISSRIMGTRRPSKPPERDGYRLEGRVGRQSLQEGINDELDKGAPSAVAIDTNAVARAIAFAIEQPKDVDINEIVVRPTAQAL